MARNITPFKDLLEPRRRETSNFMWISREIKPVVAYKQPVKPNPNIHKQEVIKSAKMLDILQKIYQENSVNKEEVQRQIQSILEEIGFNKRLPLIRWLGLLLTKICVKVFSGIHINEESILGIKQMMGSTPVIFLPSHRSYADFILMSYVCFAYDIEIPAIAAGMDFHGMWGMGKVLRDTGAFFMRRSFNDDVLYWDTFRQYITQIMTNGDLPIEFFIEGTRSRSGKSLAPKSGLLSMMLKAFFTSEVPDILFVPINITYDRVLEEKLFTYELLGVPKPKESTSGFFKSLSIIKERYGSIYVDFGKPISARTFFDSHINRSTHSISPVHLQEITQPERDLTVSLAHKIVHMQQKHSVVTAFNLVALSLTNDFISERQLPHLSTLVKDVTLLKSILESIGALTDIKNPEEDVLSSLNIHKNLVQVNNNSTVELVKNSIDIDNLDVRKLKGHAFSQETMTFVVPFVMLQIYVNPILHYLVHPAMLLVILKQYGTISKDVLREHFCFLHSLFLFEFVADEKHNLLDFEGSLQVLQNLKLITCTIDGYSLLNNKAIEVLTNALRPFLFTYYVVCRILNQNGTSPHREKSIVILIQAQLESIINKSNRFIHPYCLSLDTLSNCLTSLSSLSVLKRNKVNGDTLCQANYPLLCSVIEKLETFIDDDIQPSDEDLRSAQMNVYLDSKL